MKKLLVLFILPIFLHSQEKHSYKDSRLSCAYETLNGQLHGKYSSYYSNGKIRASGNFAYNNRVGTWEIYDSIGNLKRKRNYQNSLSFSLNDNAAMKEEAYKEGYRVYEPLEEKNVPWEKQLWQIVKPEKNTVFFQNDKLWNIIYMAIMNSVLNVFSDEEFRNLSRPEIVKERATGKKMIAFKVKQDICWDQSRQIMDSRQIGICPVITDKKDTVDLGWIYFPSLRYKIALFPAEIPLPGIKTMDDVFYFNAYSSEVEKETNVKNRSLKDYVKDKKGLEKERQRILIQVIETDHDFWLKNP